MAYIIQHSVSDVTLKGGRFSFTSVEELNEREKEIGFTPAKLIIFENDFYKAVAEVSFLM